MPFENHYIKQVLAIERIFTDIKKIYAMPGTWGAYFANQHPIYLEIGTGMGNFFSSQVLENKHINYVGIEVRRKRLHSTYIKSSQEGHQNFVLVRDYAQNIKNIFSQSEISSTYIHFPDPWTKKLIQVKHQLITEEFLNNLYAITKPGGGVEIKTDDKKYFDTIVGNIISTSWLIKEQTIDYEETSKKFTNKNITEFEGIWRGKNKKICFISLQK